MTEIKDLPIYIDTNYFSNVGYISSTIRKYHQQKGVRVVHLDYIQLLVERGLEATHELGRVSREMKLLANDLGTSHVVYEAQGY